MKNIELIKEDDLARFCSERKQEAQYLLRSTRKTYGLLSDNLCWRLGKTRSGNKNIQALRIWRTLLKNITNKNFISLRYNNYDMFSV